MKSNRRSVLIGLGALTVGGGAVFGTGAFSSVEAERSVTVDTEGDNSALLQISEGTIYNGVDVNNGNTGAVTIDFTGLNEDAESTFDNVLEVENTGTQTVDVTVPNSPTDITVNVTNGTGLSNDGSAAELSFTVDLTVDSPDTDGDITIQAN